LQILGGIYLTPTISKGELVIYSYQGLAMIFIPLNKFSFLVTIKLFILKIQSSK